MKYKKIVCVVIDSFGIGQATDTKEFDDVGADTFGHILESVSYTHLTLPTTPYV